MKYRALLNAIQVVSWKELQNFRLCSRAMTTISNSWEITVEPDKMELLVLNRSYIYRDDRHRMAITLNHVSVEYAT